MGRLLAPAALGAALCQALAALVLARRPVAAPPAAPRAAAAPRNPFDLPAVLQLGALLAVVDLLARAGRDWLGEGAVFAVAMLSGIADVDAITLSLGGMVANSEAVGSMPARQAATGVALAIATNHVAKAALAIGLGGWRFGACYGVPAAASLLLGAAGLLMLF